MIKKRAKEHKYYCKTCGARFGDDGRAFEVGTFKNGARDWHCYYCKIDEMSPDALKEFAKLQLSKNGKSLEEAKEKLRGTADFRKTKCGIVAAKSKWPKKKN